VTSVEENTLGVVVGRAAKRAATSTARWFTQLSPAHRASLGTAFLGIGATIVVAVRAVYGLTWFVALWPAYPVPFAALGGWIALAAVLVGAAIAARITGDRLSNGMFAVFLAGLAIAVACDLVAVWDLHDIGRSATAALTAGTALLAIVTLRGPTEVLTAAGALGIAFSVAIFFDIPPGTVPDARWIAAQLTAIAGAVLPALIGVVIVESFRRFVQLELDRVLVQSTVSAPRFAVGMLASEELARLDLKAEELLQSIADGATRLPLDPKTASVAASLATELRLHLIEGRRETWLYHAVSESEMLGKSVTLVDKSALAGLLDAGQRDGLLSMVWLLVSDLAKPTPTRTLTIQVGPLSPGDPGIPDGRIAIPITITSTGIARNRVDPAVWDAAGRVGRHVESTENGSLRIAIECVVDNPAESPSA